MTDLYETLEDDVIRLGCAYRQMGWWKRLWGRPSVDLIRTTLEARRSLARMQNALRRQGLDKVVWKNDDVMLSVKCKMLVEKAEALLKEVVGKFPALNVYLGETP